jgi:hypothetical protein
MREIQEALAYAAAGGQALHLHAFVTTEAPEAFKRAVREGREIAHLLDQDVSRLGATAARLGVRKIVIERQGTPRQHVDLCGKPLERARAMSEEPLLFDT